MLNQVTRGLDMLCSLKAHTFFQGATQASYLTASRTHLNPAEVSLRAGSQPPPAARCQHSEHRKGSRASWHSRESADRLCNGLGKLPQSCIILMPAEKIWKE